MRDFDGEFAPGSLIYFLVEGEGEVAQKRGVRLMDHLAQNALTITLAVSLGQIRTLIEHPSSMTHAPIPLAAQAAAGIDAGGIRLSIGTERVEDVIDDLERAFAVI